MWVDSFYIFKYYMFSFCQFFPLFHLLPTLQLRRLDSELMRPEEAPGWEERSGI